VSCKFLVIVMNLLYTSTAFIIMVGKYITFHFNKLVFDF
jgi:hypothetical protein